MLTIYTAPYIDSDPANRHILEHRLGLALLSYGLYRLFGLNIPTDELDNHLAKGAHNKPYLPAYPDIHFNISHCQGLVVCAFSNAPVGIDTENIRSFREHLLRKVLAPSEQNFLDQVSTSAEVRTEWFYRFWTLKESRIKQSGTGMSVPLTDFTFTFHPTVCSVEDYCRPESSVPELFFHQWMMKGGRHILSLCTSQNEAPVITEFPAGLFLV